MAGRYRNGAISDIWTDVHRCAERTFVRYVPRCECGWTGQDRPATASGAAACRQEWLHEHVLRGPAVLHAGVAGRA